MPTVLAEFQQVLHVQRKSAFEATPKRTVFGFIGKDGYTPYVTVPGHPRIEPGMRVLAFLRKENDWQTLLGWRDLATGELVAPELKWFLGRLVGSLGGLVVGVLLWAYGWFLDGDQAQRFGLILSSVFAITSVFTWAQWRRAKQDLQMLHAALNASVWESLRCD